MGTVPLAETLFGELLTSALRFAWRFIRTVVAATVEPKRKAERAVLPFKPVKLEQPN
jgi:hypothetical protein